MGWSAYREIHRRALIATFAATVALSGAAPALALAETTDQQANQAATQATAASDATAQATDATAAEATEAVATVDGVSYSTLADAVVAVNKSDATAEKPAELKLVASVTGYQTFTFKKPVAVTAADGVTFAGSFIFNAGANGSSVTGVSFVLPVEDFNSSVGQTHNSVQVNGTSNVTVENNKFTYPSALFKGVEWQRNGVWVQNASDVTVKGNEFELGRMNDTNGSGDVAADSNSNAAVNLVGGGDGNVSDVHVINNHLTVTAPDGAATRGASVNLLIANGNSKDGQYGVKNVTVDDNTYNGSADADNANTRFAGISNVNGITFTKNKVSDAARGVAQSVWKDNTSQNDGVTVGEGNTFANVASPFEAKTVPSDDQQTGNGAFVTKADGTFAAYGWISDAVKAINDGDDSFAGATLMLNKSVYNHSEFTFNKKVTVTTTPGSVYTFNGSITLQGAGSVVKGMNFVLDFKDYSVADGNLKKGIENSLTVEKASNVVIQDNTFTIPSVNLGSVDFQPNAIRLRYRMTGAKILNNQFNLGRPYNNSTVGINFIGGAGSAAIKDTLIQGNKATFTKDAYEGTSGSAMLVVANGNAAGQNDYGVQNLTVTGNEVDGTKVSTKDYAFSISNVNGLTLDDNAVKGVYTVVSQSMWGGTSHPSTGLVVTKNKLEDNDYNVYLDYFFNTGKMKPSDITYGGGDNANTVVWNNYKAQNPYVSGLVFAGWYADPSFKTPATDSSKPAYAKFVRKDVYTSNASGSHDGLMNFMGGALRYGFHKNNDGSLDYSQTDLRYGYTFDAPEGAEIVSWGWKFGKSADNLKGKVDGSNKRDPNSEKYDTDPDWATQGTFISNLLLTPVKSASYKTDYYVQPYISYKTADGTVMTYEGSVEHRSVETLAKAISSSESESQAAKDYAAEILKQIAE